ncbi:hypothetical protein FQA39_LY01556 [Lamprigera yunnana]|nr:hypothetical protein FQA39_LY01556 [Lamprigera yunnana]
MSRKGMSDKQLLDVLKVQSDLDISTASESEYSPSDNHRAVGNSDEAGNNTDEVVNKVYCSIGNRKSRISNNATVYATRSLGAVKLEFSD